MTEYTIYCSKNDELIIEPLCTNEDYIRFKIKIKSGEFTGASHFCVSGNLLRSFIEILSKMYKDLTGSCELNDYDSDANLKIKIQELGHVDISGQMGGSHEDHSMRFKLATDQTVLANLIQVLKAMC